MDKAPPATGPIVVAPADMKFPDLTRAIKDKVAQITSSLRTSVACAIETGALLIEAKRRVGHGNFERWVANNCDLSPATARRWMELADKRSEIEKVAVAKTLNLSDLNLSSARRLIAPPKPAPDQSAPGSAQDKGKPKPPTTEQYKKIESDLLGCLKDLRDKAESYAHSTIEALNDTVDDIKSVLSKHRRSGGLSAPVAHSICPRCFQRQRSSETTFFARWALPCPVGRNSHAKNNRDRTERLGPVGGSGLVSSLAKSLK